MAVLKLTYEYLLRVHQSASQADEHSDGTNGFFLSSFSKSCLSPFSYSIFPEDAQVGLTVLMA